MKKRHQLMIWMALDRVTQIQLGEPAAVEEVAKVLGWLNREIPMLREQMDGIAIGMGMKVPRLPK